MLRPFIRKTLFRKNKNPSTPCSSLTLVFTSTLLLNSLIQTLLQHQLFLWPCGWLLKEPLGLISWLSVYPPKPYKVRPCRSRSVFILLSVIFSYSGNGLVQCSVYIIIGYIQWNGGNGLVQCSVYIIIGYIQCYSGNGLVQGSVYIITGYILCYSGNGLVQCLYYYRLYSVLQWNGLVQCGVGGS